MWSSKRKKIRFGKFWCPIKAEKMLLRPSWEYLMKLRLLLKSSLTFKRRWRNSEIWTLGTKIETLQLTELITPRERTESRLSFQEIEEVRSSRPWWSFVSKILRRSKNLSQNSMKHEKFWKTRYVILAKRTCEQRSSRSKNQNNQELPSKEKEMQLFFPYWRFLLPLLALWILLKLPSLRSL